MRGSQWISRYRWNTIAVVPPILILLVNLVQRLGGVREAMSHATISQSCLGVFAFDVLAFLSTVAL